MPNGDCSGKCCAVFNFPVTPEQLLQRSEGREGPYPDEDRFLADMLVKLTPEEAMERGLRHEVDPPTGFDLREWSEHTGPLYTCRHWDEETRLCTVYDQRPRMCRDYPYAGRCQHDCECKFTQPDNVRTQFAAQRVRNAVRAAESNPTT
jgi:Fe-S-cluster containining protein